MDSMSIANLKTQSLLFIIIFTLSACSQLPDSKRAASKVPLVASQESQASQYEVTHCGTLPPAPNGDICHVQYAFENFMGGTVIQGDILTPEGVLEGGSIVIRGGKITEVSCTVNSGEVFALITCPGAAVTPGLINPHDHLTYDQNLPGNWGTERYDRRNQWRKGLDGHTKIEAPRADDELQWAWAEMRHILAGTTSIAGSGGYKGFLRNVDVAELQEGLTGGVVYYDTFPLGDWTDVTGHDTNCNYPQIVSKDVLNNLVFLPHVGEGVDAFAHNEIKCLTGRGYPESPGVDMAAPNSTFIHNVAGLVPDADTFKAADMSLVWSPRSNISLYGNTAPITLYDRIGLNISLSTDWTPSGSMNLFRELSCAADFNNNYLDGYFSTFDLWRMVTGNAASGLGFDDQIGTIAEGMLGDIAVIKNDSQSHYAAVIQGELSGVALVMRAGVPVYGDANVMDGLGYGSPNCEPLVINGANVCGKDKIICTVQEIGHKLAELIQHNTDAYALFFCGVPDNEPTCIPSRPNEYNGAITQSDADGDGVDNNIDNCVTTFNPVRPMDNGQQADYNQDGKGDVCDPNPN